MSGQEDLIKGSFLETLRACEGYYECPRHFGDAHLGPLVGYAGKYDGPDGKKIQYVGRVFYNCAKVEAKPIVLDHYAASLAFRIFNLIGLEHLIKIDTVLGAPMGGIALAQVLARHMECEFAFAEKKVLEPAKDGGREKSMLVLDRHEITEGDRVAIVEDVCNNFTTTAELRRLIEAAGGKLVGIICLLNRSEMDRHENAPVISCVHIPTEQFRQDDPRVADDIAKGNIIWKPKNEWSRLVAAMKSAEE